MAKEHQHIKAVLKMCELIEKILNYENAFGYKTGVDSGVDFVALIAYLDNWSKTMDVKINAALQKRSRLKELVKP